MNKKMKSTDPSVGSDEKKKFTRGSGYTYDEDQHPSDHAKPINANKDIVRLPKLSKKHHF